MSEPARKIVRRPPPPEGCSAGELQAWAADEDDLDALEEWEAIQRGDAAPEEVKVARRQIRAVP